MYGEELSAAKWELARWPDAMTQSNIGIPDQWSHGSTMTMSLVAAKHRTNNKDNMAFRLEHGMYTQWTWQTNWHMNCEHTNGMLMDCQKKESMSEKTAEGVAKSSFVENKPPLWRHDLYCIEGEQVHNHDQILSCFIKRKYKSNINATRTRVFPGADIENDIISFSWSLSWR